MSWAEAKESAEEDDKIFLRKARPFLSWLEEADSDSDSYESEEEESEEED